MKIWIPGAMIALALAGLIGMGVLYGGIPEVQVHQVFAEEYAGREVKLQGIIQKIHQDHQPLLFEVRDREDPTQVVTVEIHDTRPDIFKVDNDVAVIGTYHPETGKLVGDKVFTKCPSKYEAVDELPRYGEGAAPPAKSNPGS